MTRHRHTPEQVIRKLRDGERLLNEGKDLTEVLRTQLVGAGSERAVAYSLSTPRTLSHLGPEVLQVLAREPLLPRRCASGAARPRIKRRRP